MPPDFFASLLSLKSKLIYAGGVCGRWAIDHNSDTAVWLHLVTDGQGWIHYPERSSPVAFDAGDLIVFLPHAPTHYLSYSAHELIFDAPDARKTRFAQGTTGFVCALVELGLPRAGLWRALPAEIIVRRTQADGILGDLVRHTIGEAHGQRLGSFSVIERLCDSVFVLVVRHCIEKGLLDRGIFAAMQDRRIETVLSLIHREPWLPWTVATLSAQAGVSRTVLTSRFTRIMGCPPGAYLDRWRMQSGADLLLNCGLPVEVIAERCGYASVSAFSRAFKQSFGVSPGAWRRTASSAERAPVPRRQHGGTVDLARVSKPRTGEPGHSRQ